MKIRPAYALLAGAALLGAIAVYVETTRTTAQPSDRLVNSGEADGPRPAVRSARVAVEPPEPTGNPLWALPLKQLSITRDRPIFSPSRRPPPPPPPAYVAPVAAKPPPKVAEPDRPAITLLGTILGGAEGIGVFLEPATRNIMRLRMGEDHQGWVLHAVKTREVTLVKDRETVVLELPPPGDSAMLTNDFTPNIQPVQPARRPRR
jgi:general secretion pathway protein N